MTMPTAEATKEKARTMIIVPIRLGKATLPEAIDYLNRMVALMECDGAGPGIQSSLPIELAESADMDLPPVCLLTTNDASLAVLASVIAVQTGLRLLYSSTGLLLAPPAPCVPPLMIAEDVGPMAARAPTDGEEPSASEKPAIHQHADEAATIEATIRERWPQVDAKGSPESCAFFRLYHALGARHDQAVGIAELLFIYPVRT